MGFVTSLIFKPMGVGNESSAIVEAEYMGNGIYQFNNMYYTSGMIGVATFETMTSTIEGKQFDEFNPLNLWR